MYFGFIYLPINIILLLFFLLERVHERTCRYTLGILAKHDQDEPVDKLHADFL